MGSLLPGWDERAPGVAPKEFQDFDEDEEKHLGYFAAYNKMKKELKALGDLDRKPGSLRRQSMPIGRVSDPLAVPTSPHGGSFTKSYTFSPRSLERHSLPRELPHLQRLGSLPARAGDRFDRGEGSTPRTPKSPTSPFGASGSPTSLDQYKISQDHKQDIQWWRNFDSAHLNEMPDIPVSKERGYIPQYKVTGQQMHFHVDQDHDASDASVQAQ